MIVLKYVLCIHCYYTPEVAAAVYFISTLSHTWTELMKKYSKVSMKCLSLPAYHLSGDRRRILFSVAWIYIPSDGFCKNRTKLLTELISDSAVGLPLHQMHGTLHGFFFFLVLFCKLVLQPALENRIKRINEVVHPSGNLLKRVPPPRNVFG